jgi:hypothetical protein
VGQSRSAKGLLYFLREEKPMKYKTTNESKPEHAQVDYPNLQPKTK